MKKWIQVLNRNCSANALTANKTKAPNINPLIIITISVLMLSIQGCGFSDYLFQQSPESDKDKLDRMINNHREKAIKEIDFYDIKENPAEYRDKIIEMRGYIVDTRNEEFLFYADPYYDENYGFYYVSLDNPLPRQTSMGTPLKYLAAGSRITLIAKILNLQSYGLSRSPIMVSIKNYVLSVQGKELIDIPHLGGIAIYRIENEEMERPEWVTIEILEKFGLKR